MCQLLGMNCNTPTDVMFSFTGFAQRGGRTGEHVDGWGIAFFEDRGLRHFVDHQGAAESPVAELIRRYPIKSENVVAHIRKATQGAVNLQNCHPFVRELWGRRRRGTGRSTSCCPTARRCGRTAPRSCSTSSASTRSRMRSWPTRTSPSISSATRSRPIAWPWW